MDRLSKRGSVRGKGCLEKTRVEVSEGVAGIGMMIKDRVRERHLGHGRVRGAAGLERFGEPT